MKDKIVAYGLSLSIIFIALVFISGIVACIIGLAGMLP